MKQVMSIVLLFATVLTLFAGCGKPVPAEEIATDPALANVPTVLPTEIPTEPATEPPTEVHTEPVQPESKFPYLQKITQPDQSIFDGPGYDNFLVGTVEVSGTYTIIEEATDYEGNLWGRLKSGAGWVDLTEIRRHIQNPPVLTANFADDRLLASGNFHHYVGQPSEFAVTVAFRTNEILTDVTFFSMDIAEFLQKDQDLFTIDELTPEKPFVAEIAFPGDFTTYGIRFTDQRGNVCCHTISISGRNGTLCLSEYIP